MSHLLEEYAKNLGVRISKPIVSKHYWPIKYDKFITINTSSVVQSKTYKHYNIVCQLLRPILNNHGIKIIQIGSSQSSERLMGVDDYIFDLPFKNLAYVLSKSMAHIGTDDYISHCASSEDIPCVTLFGNVYSSISKGFWGKNKNLEPKWKVKPCLSNLDPNSSINTIMPEEVASSILELLKIDNPIKLKSKYIGPLYNVKITEIVPNFITNDERLNRQHCVFRLDLGGNLDTVIQWSRFMPQFSMVVEGGVPAYFFSMCGARPKSIAFILNKENYLNFSEEYFKEINSLGIEVSILVKNEEDLGLIREHFFDLLISKFEVAKRNQLPDGFEFGKYVFHSSKVILSHGKQYVSTYHFKNEINFIDKNFILLDNDVLLEDLNYFYVHRTT